MSERILFNIREHIKKNKRTNRTNTVIVMKEFTWENYSLFDIVIGNNYFFNINLSI